MYKALAVLGICVAAAIIISGIPNAVESAVPVSETLCAGTRGYCEKAEGGGEVSYSEQHEITFALPLVIEKFNVREGDEVNVGDTIAAVDRKSSAELLESLGKLQTLAISSADISTAAALLPETITSDCSGRVISISGSGKAVQSGSSIATVAKTDDIEVTAAVSELDISKVKVGQKAEFTLAAYPDETFSGHVSKISQAARNRYNGAVLETVLDVAITPDKPDERLKSGLSAQTEIMLSDPREVLVVPYSAISQDDEGEFVYVYENQKAVRKNIVTGAEFSDGAEIKSGIGGSDIVFANPEEIANKSYVRVAELVK